MTTENIIDFNDQNTKILNKVSENGEPLIEINVKTNDSNNKNLVIFKFPLKNDYQINIYLEFIESYTLNNCGQITKKLFQKNYTLSPECKEIDSKKDIVQKDFEVFLFISTDSDFILTYKNFTDKKNHFINVKFQKTNKLYKDVKNINGLLNIVNIVYFTGIVNIIVLLSIYYFR